MIENFLRCDCAVAGLTGADGRPMHDPVCRWGSVQPPARAGGNVAGKQAAAGPISLGEEAVSVACRRHGLNHDTGAIRDVGQAIRGRGNVVHG